MSLYFIQIAGGKYAGISDLDDVGDRAAAWNEMTKVCADLVGGIARELKENELWQIDLMDLSKKPIFRIRLVAETLD